jgi:hypothetical protein
MLLVQEENSKETWCTESFQYIICCSKKLNPLLSLYVKKNKNYDTYSRYFEETKDEQIIRFKGLRDSNLDDKYEGIIEWVE